MNHQLHHPRSFPLLLASLGTGLTAFAQGTAPTEEPVAVLERFIMTESALALDGDVMPTSRPFYSVFGSQDIVDVPRSVTVLTPQLLSQFGIQDFSDLDKIGAGTQQTNYYGVPGTPTLRGSKGGVYFNGMQRAWQRNEMPLSFGSLEAIDLVKGPAPAHFGASQIGGYANLIPKSPYFDKKRGSVMLEIGSDDHFRMQTDVGGPTMLFGKPAAYRVSLTGQLADSYYDRIGNDFVSLYASVKSLVAKDVTIKTGGEFFKYKSNENAGWNRPTQNLIDNGQYVIGEPVSISSPAWGGNAVRTLTEYPFTFHLAPAYSSPLLALALPGDVARARIPAAQLALMIDMNQQANVNAVYQALPQGQVPGFASPGLLPVTVEALAQVAKTTQDVYIYTPAYFAAGGQVLTDKIEGSTVLSDSADFANSKNFLYFFDVESNRNANVALKGQLLIDYIDTQKLSTYGYAIDTEQLVIELKGTATQSFDFLKTNLTYGASARYTDAYMLQDFYAEPFSRRDISLGTISTNSVILTGGQVGPDGNNFWSPTSQGGANADSRLWQLSLFGYSENKFTEAFRTYTSVLVAHAPYRTGYPSEVDLVPANDPRRNTVSDKKNYYSVSFSPVFTVTPGVNLYATIQRGTALDPLQGGAIIGKNNFSKNKLLEAGVKTSLFEGRLFASLAGYEWEQTRFDDRTGGAEPLEGEGVEFEITYAPMKSLTFIASINNQRVKRLSPLGFRAPAATEQDWALYGGVLAFNSAPGVPAANPDLIYPGTPETQAKLFAIYNFSNGFGISGGPIWSDSYWHNFDRTIKLPSTVVWNASVFFTRPSYEISLSVENVTNEDYFRGADPVFAANTVITKAPETNGKLTFTYKF